MGDMQQKITKHNTSINILKNKNSDDYLKKHAMFKNSTKQIK